MGQDAASERHHCRNTNVVGNFISMRVDIHEVDNDVVFVYTYDKRDIEFRLFLWTTVGQYRIRKDKPHSDKGEYHIHVYEGENEILAINKSGTAHDQSHGKRIPNRVYDYLKMKYPTWNWPTNQIIPFLITSQRWTGYLRKVKYFDTEEKYGHFHGLGEVEIENNGQRQIVTRAIIETDTGKLISVEIDKIEFLE